MRLLVRVALENFVLPREGIVEAEERGGERHGYMSRRKCQK